VVKRRHYFEGGDVIIISTIAAVWLGLGAFFAIYGLATEDMSENNVFRIVLFVSVVLGWPLTFLPNQREYPSSGLLPHCARRKPELRIIVGGAEYGYKRTFFEGGISS
jgi:hypothetical protein